MFDYRAHYESQPSVSVDFLRVVQWYLLFCLTYDGSAVFQRSHSTIKPPNHIRALQRQESASSSEQSDQSPLGILWVAKAPKLFVRTAKTDHTVQMDRLETSLDAHNGFAVPRLMKYTKCLWCSFEILNAVRIDILAVFLT